LKTLSAKHSPDYLYSNMEQRPSLVLGAVAYLPKVVTIWEGIRTFFQEQGLDMDFVLFSNYEQQVDFLVEGKIDIAWNTPLAHVRVKHRTGMKSLSLGMRDSDRDFHCRLVVAKAAKIKTPQQLEGKRLGVGSQDSTQARILPLHFLKAEGVNLEKVKIVPFDTDLGKHGDTGRSELDCLEALAAGKVDAIVLGDLIWVSEQAAGHVPTDKMESIWTSPGFDHCMFDALPMLAPEKLKAFQKALFAMRWEVPQHRRLLELEGLKKWLEPRESGYDSLWKAIEEQGVPL
jgi:phosphonate transport system substrate-binding protein